ncbi:CD1871A family CXXC motif-containing protein [Ammonifex thiophilus]|nr:CD1871A family CXXC motif-containing protein [Ammonifex thiophilus]
MRRWLGRLSLFLGLALVVWGLLRGEFQFLWLKGIRFCLECMGLG